MEGCLTLTASMATRETAHQGLALSGTIKLGRGVQQWETGQRESACRGSDKDNGKVEWESGARRAKGRVFRCEKQ